VGFLNSRLLSGNQADPGASRTAHGCRGEPSAEEDKDMCLEELRVGHGSGRDD
ncbi:unnamed protein product, partial [Musa textilis]